MDNILTKEFLSRYRDYPEYNNILGLFVYLRTYSRRLEHRWETWKETVTRVVNHSMSLYNGPANKESLQREAEDLFDNIFNMRVFPSGRSLWIAGTAASEIHPTANFNCAFAVIDSFDKFVESMYLLMVGSGVGFRILPEDVAQLAPIDPSTTLHHVTYTARNKEDREEETRVYHKDNRANIYVGDSKSGWTNALSDYFSSLINPDIKHIYINYDSVRPEGEPLKTFGGYASGHEALKTMFDRIHSVVKRGDSKLTPLQCMDIMNIIGMCIVVGGTRRTAEIALFDVNDEEIRKAKDNLWVEGSDTHFAKDWRGASNNSIFFKEKPSRDILENIFKSISLSAEPGFVNYEAMQSRRVNAKGANPCLEILLDDRGMCNLSEVNLMAFVHEGIFDIDAAYNAIAHATRIGMRMTNVTMEMPAWDKVQKRDRLTGVSLTGIMDFVDTLSMSLDQLASLLDRFREHAHNVALHYAYEMRIPLPLLICCIKPSGSISQLPTVSSGVHRSYAPYYIRRVRISSATPLAKSMLKLGYPVYPEAIYMLPQDFDNLNNYDRMKVLDRAATWVIEFPVKTSAHVKSTDESALDQFKRYLTFQEHWTDHNTSITITYDESESPALIDAILDKWDEFVGISFLPKDSNIYPLMPYEAITEEEYHRRELHITEQDLINALYDQDYVFSDDLEIDCSSGACPVR
jgi:adenosylcobalamin-dependent ribonucleoside-triphosphate reductase